MDLSITLSGFIAYTLALAVAAAIPGPGITALVARALGSGFMASFWMSVGLILGDLTYLLAVLLGLAVLAQTFGVAFLVVKWLGVLYLAWLAWQLWTTGVIGRNIEAIRTRESAWSSVLAGLLVTLGNPKTMIFYIAITPTIIDLKTVTAADAAMLVAITAVTLLIVIIPYLALAAKARGLFKRPRALKIINRTAAGFLAAAAAAIAFRAP
jgi:threonine/homoserine/homoserine lactone efflux protein